ncbi:sigma-70 family RNA polymerase sigma factor [Streptomyces sp. col6]|uniref:RNA polymerase sigma factor n=1 Tax=Streptomyces sp. col6 TaxID=2478958 RepID=UPI0011CE4F4C|nr:sigma-70 family RNA polymerase sigma factor [Streptomyces sp. col6]TXR94514.1 sigma-70 family RNA polymerase sigma factor [Streptomyces sp. col6]
MTDPFGRERDLVGPDPEPPKLDPRGEAFFRDHMETFMRIAAYRVRNPHDAEDAVMDAVVTMHRRIERILAASSPIALATKILGDAIKDHHRRSVRIATREHLVPELPSTSYFVELGRYDLLDRAMEELEVIAPQQALCVQLYDLVGLSYAQVAEIAESTESAARANVSRGRKHLTELMGTELPKEKGDS